MSDLVISGNTSGTITLRAPNVAGSTILTLDTTTGTLGSGLGFDQTWQDLTASRAVSTTYTNSSGKPIQVVITLNGTAAGGTGATISINGVAHGNLGGYGNGAGYRYSNFFIIPNNVTYGIGVITNGTLFQWSELR